MFGGTLTLGRRARQLAHEEGAPDVILASDMVDLPGFLGHAGPALGNPRTVLYMHENQITYPLSPTARDDLAYAYMNWSSMVVADEVWFNSEHHRRAVFDAIPGFLRHFPDHRHNSLIDGTRENSRVVPVGVELSWLDQDAVKEDPPLVIWNQRWEYDKDPVRLFGALGRLSASGADFRLAICGENFRNIPVEFEDAKSRLAKHIVHYGYAERDHYEWLLNRASIVVSTARHEFFGVAAVEAMAAGAVPVFPHDLSYPELIPREAHQSVLYETDAELDLLLSTLVQDRTMREELAAVISPTMERYSWETVTPLYDSTLSRLAGH